MHPVEYKRINNIYASMGLICVYGAIGTSIRFRNTSCMCSVSCLTITNFPHPFQEESAQWNNYVSYVQIIPAIISNIMLSSYCDKVGHKLPLLLPLLGSLIYMPWLLVNSLPQYIVSWPMAFILIYAGVYGCFGSFAMVS